METDFDWHDIKKCCGESNNFNYVCDVRLLSSIDLLLSSFLTLITCYDWLFKKIEVFKCLFNVLQFQDEHVWVCYLGQLGVQKMIFQSV